MGCVVALLVAGLVLWPDGDEPLDDAADGDAPEAALDSLPSVDSASDADEAEPEDGSEADVSDDQILSAAPENAEGDVTSIVLPSSVAAITEPTEIVMVAGGDIVTVSLPSGTVRRRPASASANSSGGFIVAPDAAAWFNGSDLSIVPRVGPALSVDVGDGSEGGFVRDWMTDDSGSTIFLVDTFGPSDNQQYTVSVDGEVEPFELDAAQFDLFALYGGLRSGSGTAIVNDAGGVYVINADDVATRISEGRALASNERFVLLRECDETLSCGYSVLDRATSEQRASPVTTAEIGASYGFDLAPDGTATLTIDYDSQRRRVVDLVTGTVTAEVALPPSSGNNTQWAADSSGVFQIDTDGSGITFIDRATGESVTFGAELGRISDLGTRMPDAELDSVENVVSDRSLVFSDELSGPIGIDLVVLGDGGSIGYLDLDAATASVWSVPAFGGSNAPDLFSNGTTVTVLRAGTQKGFVTEFGSPGLLEPDEGASLPGFPRYPGPTPGTVWSPVDGRTDGVGHQLLAIDGTIVPNGGAIYLDNSELLGDDATGRLVARVGGDVFVVGLDDAAKLTDGELLALGPNYALVRSCGDVFACSVQRVRRSDGQVLDDGQPSPEVVEVLGDIRPVVEPNRSPRLGGTMSPDGGAAFVRGATLSNTAEWLVVDFAAVGRFVVPAPVNGQPIVWNAEGSVAVYLAENGVTIVERSTGRVSTIEGLGVVRAITAVGPDFAAAGG